MQWKSEYETGIAEIDGQHQTVMRLVAEFETAINVKAHWNSLHPLLTRAKEYAKFHFSVEESLMGIFKYPRLSAHRSEHHFVLNRIANLEARVLRQDRMEDLVPQFRIWLLGHFLDSDQHFVSFIRTATPMAGGVAAPIDQEPVPIDADALEQAMRRAVGLEKKAAVVTDHREVRALDWIAWDSLVSTNHAAMDADHKQLVTLFNDLAEAVTTGKGESECTRLLDDIVGHTRKHFAFEEQLMETHAYPQAAAHSAEHILLLDQALKYKAKFQSGFSESHIALIHFPEDWLTRHIARMDRPLGEFLAAAG